MAEEKVIKTYQDGDYLVEVIEQTDETGTLIFERRTFSPVILPEIPAPGPDTEITTTELLARLEALEDVMEKLKTFVGYKDPAS